MRRLVDAGVVVVAAAGSHGKTADGRKVYGDGVIYSDDTLFADWLTRGNFFLMQHEILAHGERH